MELTHVAAPFMQSMVEVSRPDRPLRYVRTLDWQTTYFDVTISITPEMYWGCKPDKPILGKPRPLGWIDSQTTHVPAGVSQEMLNGWRPDANRAFVKPQLGWIAGEVNVQATFTSDMVAGQHPDSPRLFRKPSLGWQDSQTTHVPAPLSQEMVTGWHPDTTVQIFYGPRLGWQTSQLTHVQAPFSPEMAAGYHPDTPLAFKLHLGSSELAQEIIIISVTPEMFWGWHPDQPVLGKPKPFGWQDSQLTHVPAAFGQEMVLGSGPSKPMLWRPKSLDWTVNPPQAVVLFVLSQEMMNGYHPDKPILGKPFPAGWIHGQVNHVQAPFSIEMVTGVTHARPMLRKPQPIGWSELPQIIAAAPPGTALRFILVDGQLAMQVGGMFYTFV